MSDANSEHGSTHKSVGELAKLAELVSKLQQQLENQTKAIKSLKRKNHKESGDGVRSPGAANSYNAGREVGDNDRMERNDLIDRNNDQADEGFMSDENHDSQDMADGSDDECDKSKRGNVTVRKSGRKSGAGVVPPSVNENESSLRYKMVSSIVKKRPARRHELRRNSDDDSNESSDDQTGRSSRRSNVSYEPRQPEMGITQAINRMAKSVSGYSNMSQIKRCDTGVFITKRVQFVKACTDTVEGEDFMEAWHSLKLRSNDVPGRCKNLANPIVARGKTMSKKEWLKIAQHFVFRSRSVTADRIAEEATMKLDDIAPRGIRGLEAFYGKAHKLWNNIKLAYKLEARHSKPARATETAFLKKFISHLPGQMSNVVTMRRSEAVNNGKTFKLVDAYRMAQVYKDAYKDTNVRRSFAGNIGSKRKRDSNSDEDSDEEPRKRTPCHFHAKGRCSKGRNCKFSHDEKLVVVKRRQRQDSSMPDDRRSNKFDVNRGDHKCGLCGDSEHTRSECPRFKGCFRCGGKHYAAVCKNGCRECHVKADERCKSTCTTRKPDFRPKGVSE